MTWFILILEATMPSAQNSVLMLQVAGGPSKANGLAKFLFIIYVHFKDTRRSSLDVSVGKMPFCLLKIINDMGCVKKTHFAPEFKSG